MHTHARLQTGLRLSQARSVHSHASSALDEMIASCNCALIITATNSNAEFVDRITIATGSQALAFPVNTAMHRHLVLRLTVGIAPAFLLLVTWRHCVYTTSHITTQHKHTYTLKHAAFTPFLYFMRQDRTKVTIDDQQTVAPAAIWKWRGTKCWHEAPAEKFSMCPSTFLWCPCKWEDTTKIEWAQVSFQGWLYQMCNIIADFPDNCYIHHITVEKYRPTENT